MNKVNASTLLIKVDDQQYPLNLYQVRQNHKNISIAKEPTVEQLEELGYAVVQRVERPTGDVVTEGTPVLVNGNFTQTWIARSFTTEELASQFNTKKQNTLNEIDRIRNRDLSKGFLHTFPDATQYHIQLRDGDRANLSGLRIKADSLAAQGILDPVMSIMTYENVSKALTPAQMVEATDAAFTGYMTIMEASWNLRAQAEAATTEAELPVVPETLVPVV